MSGLQGEVEFSIIPLVSTESFIQLLSIAIL